MDLQVIAPDGRAGRRPVRRLLILGGARSGKSQLAERLLAPHPEVRYVATGPHDPTDGEWSARVAEHRRRRPQHWTTVETTDVAAVLRDLDAGQAALVDCLTLWAARLCEAEGVEARIDELLAAWSSCAGEVVAVSNEVGCGVVPAYPSGRRFRDLLGLLNARMAAASDDVILMVAGIARSLLHGDRVVGPCEDPQVRIGGEQQP